MGRLLLPLALCIALPFAHAQQPATTPDKPLPDIHQLILDVESNQKAAEALQKDYTYHVHTEAQDFDKNGATKKTKITDAESVTIDGVRVDRVVARDGKPLTPDEQKKESERIDKAVAKAKDHRASNEDHGKDTDANGDNVLSAARILELGQFTNPHRIDYQGHPTIVVDYAGDPNAKTRNTFEKAFRDLVGTVWIDEQDRVLVRAQGHFLNDFKTFGGLVVDIHKGLSFAFAMSRADGKAWLPAVIEYQGNARFFLLEHLNGHVRIAASNYRKFRTSTTIIPTGRMIGPNGEPISPPGLTNPPPPRSDPQH
jgi:hypothetical protein